MRAILIFSTLVVVCGCSLRLEEPNAEPPQRYIYATEAEQQECPLDEQWWECFGDEELNERIEVALNQNRNLEATLESLIAAKEYLRAANATALPTLGLDATAQVTHEEGFTTRQFSVAPALKWEVSLFGKRYNTRLEAAASLQEQAWSYRAAWLALCSQVATTHFTLLKYRRSLFIATRSYQLRRSATALIDSMQRIGTSNATALMQAKSLVYTARSEMEQYQRAVALTSLSLSTLLGQSPEPLDWGDAGRELIEDALPFSIPTGLPSSLLERRPDVMESYYAMAQAAAKVGIARAARYPSITLSASGGLLSSTVGGLTFSDKAALWGGTAEIVAPIVSWGALRRRERYERALYRASVASYEQAVLEAVADVESALITIETYNDQTTASSALVLANTKIAQNTSAMYRAGMGDYLSVIDAERELYASQISLIDLVAQQYINYVDLFKALGGGWPTAL